MIQIENITNQLYREKDNPKRFGTNKIVVHWDGVHYDGDGVQNAKNIAWWTVRNKKYANTIQYHARITRDGKILKCLDWNDRVWHATNDSVSRVSIALCVEGNNPTERQQSLLAQTIGYLQQLYNKKLEVGGHRQYASIYTDCPGEQLLANINKFNSVGGANTIMEKPFNKGDVLQVTTGIGRVLNVRAKHSTDARIVKQLKRGDNVEALGNVKEENGYVWVDINFGEATGWAASNWLKRIKSAEKVEAETIGYHLSKAREHIDEAIKLA